MDNSVLTSKRDVAVAPGEGEGSESVLEEPGAAMDTYVLAEG